MELIQTNELLKIEQKKQALDMTLLNKKVEEYKNNYEAAKEKYNTFYVI